MSKRLTLLIEEFNASGGVRILTAICNVASEVGIVVLIVCPDYASINFFPINPRIRIKKISILKTFRKLGYMLGLCRLCWGADGIFVTGSYRLISLIGIIARLRGHKKPLLVVQGLDRVSLIEIAQTPYVLKQLNRCLLALAERLACHRVYVSKFLQKVSGAPGVLIPNFVDEQFFCAAPLRGKGNQSKIRVGCTSTAAPNKGFPLFLSASIELSNDPDLAHLDIEFVCATQDQKLVLQHENSNVDFVRPESDIEMHEFYSRCDIFASLSVSEGFGLPVLEAMASGCAIVCTNSGGVTDFVHHEVNGLMCERSLLSVVLGIKHLLLNPAKRMELSAAGKAQAKHYNFDVFRSRYIRLFAELGLIEPKCSEVRNSTLA